MLLPYRRTIIELRMMRILKPLLGDQIATLENRQLLDLFDKSLLHLVRKSQ